MLTATLPVVLALAIDALIVGGLRLATPWQRVVRG